MAREQLEDLSTEKLLKRKRLATWVLGLLLFTILLSIAVTAYFYILDKEFQVSTMAGGFGCVPIVLVLAGGLKKIRRELERRG